MPTARSGRSRPQHSSREMRPARWRRAGSLRSAVASHEETRSPERACHPPAIARKLVGAKSALMPLRLLVLVIVAASITAAQANGSSVSPTSVQGERVLFPANCQKPVYRPKTIIVTCADANFTIEKISWNSWTTTRAAGRGTARVNNCTPDCAGGTFETFPVRVTLSTPKRCRPGKPLQFVRIAVVFTGERPAGFPRTERLPYGCGVPG